jgi:HAD superfamily hydrolase (TIGR01509 family)
MIKALYFDCDGVLCDLVQVHYIALNTAINKTVGSKFIIEEHEEDIFNGIPTRSKLSMLTTYKGLPQSSHKEIERLKQKLTIEAINKTLTESDELIRTFKNLKSDKYITACISNSISATIDAALYKIGIRNYIDFIVSNETVINNKPSPSMYLYGCSRGNVSPWEVLCFEDSDKGMQSVIRAGCNLCVVRHPSELTEEFIRSAIHLYE